MSVSCVPRSEADAIVSKNDGACIGGSCSAGASLAVPISNLGLVTNWNGSANGATQPISVPGGALDVELSSASTYPLAPNGSISSPFFATRHTELLNTGGSACVSLGATTFGVPSAGTSTAQTTQDSGPLISLDEPVFINQTQSSASGAGWGISQVGRLYASNTSYVAVVVQGNGDQETFSPRATLSIAPSTNLPREYTALATDTTTGQTLLAQQSEIDLVNPVSGTTTPLLSGVNFPSPPFAMAVTYVAGVRHLVVALDTELVDVNAASAAVRVLAARTPPAGETASGNNEFSFVPGVAANNATVFYVSGLKSDPTVYSFDLSDASPVAEALTLQTGGSASLDPVVPLSEVTLGDPHGLAYIAGQGLYIADRQRDVVYLAAPQSDGQVGGESPVTRAIGSGASRFLPPLGYGFAGPQFPLNQPAMLAVGPDGMLWVVAPFGLATYDPTAREAHWVFFDGSVSGSESGYRIGEINNSFTFAPLGPTSLLAIDADVFQININLLSSEFDPTRTLTFDGSQSATLTDTTQDTVDLFDTHGLFVSRSRRTGELMSTATYLAGTGQLASVVDAAGGATTFAYDSNSHLHSVTDPAGRSTTVVVNSSGDSGILHRARRRDVHVPVRRSPDDAEADS